jgi:HPt (histidine-containing phosphotransfer) domain-containing protein
MRASTSRNSASVRADLAFWSELAGGDESSGRELVALFLATTADQISVMVSGLATANTGAVSRAAHSCVSSCSTCGLVGLAQLFRRVECEAHDGRLDALSHTIPLIVEVFDDVRTHLSPMLAASASASIEERA